MKSNMIGTKYEYFVEQGATYREAMDKVAALYGDRAKILTRRQTKAGGFLGLFRRDVVELQGYISNETAVRKPALPANADLEEEKRKLLEGIKKDRGGDFESLIKEVRELKSVIETKALGEEHRPAQEADLHPAIAAVEDILDRNEFSRGFTKEIVQRMKKEMSVDFLSDEAQVHARVVEWIGDTIQVFPKVQRKRPQVVVLVGPTGVGKTTTIAKLAAMQKISRDGGAPRKVRIITIDNYRIGAKYQIETYGEIMDIPVSTVESIDEMKKYRDLYEDADIIFVDTIGKSPRDYEALGRMKNLLSAVGSDAEVHLAMSATTKPSDMQEIMKQFEPFGYESIIITKLDETNRVGGILSTLWEKRKALSYLTVGQTVPSDILEADPVRLLIQLEGFRIHRASLDERYATGRTE